MDHSDNPRRTLSEALRTGSLGEAARSFLAGPVAARQPSKCPDRLGSPPGPGTPPRR